MQTSIWNIHSHNDTFQSNFFQGLKTNHLISGSICGEKIELDFNPTTSFSVFLYNMLNIYVNFKSTYSAISYKLRCRVNGDNITSDTGVLLLSETGQ